MISLKESEEPENLVVDLAEKLPTNMYITSQVPGQVRTHYISYPLSQRLLLQ